ncbi:MAG: lectin like domain-containing protein [Sulfuricellaceae bacterium]
MLSDAHVFFKPESTANYARAYLYDPFGQTSSWGYSSYTAWGANVFTATADEILQAVAFYTLQVDSSYEISIYNRRIEYANHRLATGFSSTRILDKF